MNNATCVAKYEGGDYQCACAAGYIGKHCEIGISTHQFGRIVFFIITNCYTLPTVIYLVLLDVFRTKDFPIRK